MVVQCLAKFSLGVFKEAEPVANTLGNITGDISKENGEGVA